MTVVIESAASGTRNSVKSRLNAYPGPDRVAGKQDMKPANDAGYDLRATRGRMVYSRHTHYDPLQIAIEEGLDGWARHAMASNGFGDLP